MEKLKFCLVNNWYPPHNFAGSGAYLYHLANALVKGGHDVTVLYSKNSFQLRSKGRIHYDFKRVWHSKQVNDVRKYIKDGNCYCPMANQAYSNILCDVRSMLKVFKNIISI